MSITNNEIHLSIQRIYVKDISFESPCSPKIFKAEWQPTINLDLSTNITTLDDSMHEVMLQLTVTGSLDEAVAFICQVQQAGIFFIKGLSGEDMDRCFSNDCLTILFPYARECVSDLLTRGTFPPLYLAPINFNALFHEYLKNNQHKNESETTNS